MNNTIMLTDLSPMPFGKHKGSPMQDVPASYLRWFRGALRKGDITGVPIHPRGLVADYIRRNLEALKANHPDGIW